MKDESILLFLVLAGAIILFPATLQAITLIQTGNFSVYLHGGNGSTGYASLNLINLSNANITNATLTSYACSGSNCNFTVVLDSLNYSSVNSLFNITDLTNVSVYYNASDGSWRNVTELGNIGQGYWNLNNNSGNYSVNYTLAGADGMDYGIRDALPGGSYWLTSAGGLYSNISISNDFVNYRSNSTGFALYNSTNGLLFNSTWNSILLDNSGLNSTYNLGSTQNTTVYFFDWTNQTWKVWMNGTGNSSAGMPNWLDPRNKQEFKWRYSFANDTALNRPAINYTFLMIAQDPFVRVFTDTSSTMPSVIQTPGRIGNCYNVNNCSNMAFSSNVSAGDTIVLAAVWSLNDGSGCPTVSSITDTQSLTYTKAITTTYTSGSYCTATSVYYSTTTSSGSESVNWTLSKASGGNFEVWGYEVRGISTSAASIHTGNNTGFQCTGSTIQTSSPVSFIGGAFLVSALGFCGSGVETAGSGFTAQDGSPEFAEYAIANSVSSPSSFPMTISSSCTSGCINSYSAVAFDPLPPHNLTIPISLGTTKTLQSFSTNKTGVFFTTSGGANEEVLFSTDNWKNNTHAFNLTVSSTMLNYSYAFNNTINNNFLFSLGTGGFANTSNNVPTVVQTNSTTCTSASSCSVAFTSSVASGDVLVAMVASYATNDPGGTFTDSQGSYTVSVSCVYPTSCGNAQYQAIAKRMTSSSGADTVTYTAGSGTGTIYLFIMELSGVSVTSSPTSSGTCASSCGTTASVSSFNAINGGIVAGIISAAARPTVTTGSGFSSFCQSGDPCGIYSTTISGSTNAAVTLSSGQPWDYLTVDFNPIFNTSRQIQFSNETIESVANSTLTYYDLKPTTAPTTIGTSTSNVATMADNQLKTCYANGRYWVYYFDGTNIVFRSSTDGTTWSSNTTVRAPLYNSEALGIACSGNTGYYAITVAGTMTYRSWTFNSDGTVTYLIPEGSFTFHNTAGYLESATTIIDGSSNWWITAVVSDGVIGGWCEMWVSTSLSSPSFSYKHEFFLGPGGDRACSVISLTSGVGVVFDNATSTVSVTTSADTGSTWSSVVNSTASYNGVSDHQYVSIGNNVIGVATGSNRITFLKFTYGGGSWTETTVSNDAFQMGAISTDGSTKIAIAIADASNTTVYQFVSSDTGATWVKSTVATSESNIIVHSLSAGALVNGNYPLIWTAGTGSPYNVRFESIPISSWNKQNESSSITQSTVYPSFNYDGGAAGIWHFDEGAGANVTDASGNGNSGYINGSVTWTAGKYGNALNFSGTVGSWVNINNNSVFNYGTRDFSIEGWIKTTQTSFGAIYDKYVSGVGGWLIEVGGCANKLDFEWGGGDLCSATSINDGSWHYFVLVRNSAGRKMYIDGKLDGVISEAPHNGDNIAILSLGRRYQNGGFNDLNYNGLLDEFRIYPRALTDQEIWEQYARQASFYYDDFGTAASGKTYRYFGVEDSNTSMEPITPTGTVLHLRFNDNSTVNVTDSSGLGNNGRVVNGATWLTNSSCKINFGGCMNFLNSSSQYIQLTRNPISSGSFSIAMWAYPTNLGSLQALYTSNLQVMRIEPAGQIHVYPAGTTGVLSNTALTNNNWYNIVWVYNDSGTSNSIYINGFSDAGGGAVAAFDSSIPNIGAYYPPNYYFNGVIDEVLVINRSLSSDEVYQLYLGGYNRTINNHTHRVAASDGIFSDAYNLTAHDPSVLQDYDQRNLLITGTTQALLTQPPQYSNVGSNALVATPGSSVLLYSYWTDSANLSYIILSTNETGVWQNYTAGTYGSPLANLAVNSSWANFTWQNSSVPTGTVVGWQVYSNDTSNNWNVTNVSTFSVQVSNACYLISGQAYDLYTGLPISSGTVTAIVKETGEKNSATFTNGAYSLCLYSTLNASKNSFTLGVIVNGSPVSFGWNTIVVGGGPFATQTQTCSVRQNHFTGNAISTTGAIGQGTVAVSVNTEKGPYTNSTSFTNGFWDIYITPCLISGRLYTYSFAISSNDGKSSILTIQQIAK